MKPEQIRWLMRAISAAALFVPMIWLAWAHTAVPLLLLLGISAALVSIRVGQAGEQRYGRRVPVTEMFTLGRREKDRALQTGGICGYLMLVFFALAAWQGFTE